MPRFRKKPVVIEAIKYLGGGNIENHETTDWMWNAFETGVMRYDNGSDPLIIKTLEGDHTVSPGDFIIRIYLEESPSGRGDGG